MFHLFICSNLSGTVMPTVLIGKGHTRRIRGQIAWSMLYLILRIAISAYVLSRLRFWSDTPGQCFIIPVAPHIDGIKLFTAWTALRIAAGVVQLIIFLRVGKSMRQIQGSMGTTKPLTDGHLERSRASCLVWSYVLFKILMPVVPFIFNTYWTVALVLANQGHVLGDENIFTFGQVGALVALVASLYGIVSSYLGKRITS